MTNNQSIPVPGYVQQSYFQAPPSPSLHSTDQQQYGQATQPMQVYTVQDPIPPPLGRHPTRMLCPSCHADITTDVKYNVGQKTHIIALLICCCTGCCCCLPYCFNTCKTAGHYCPNCKIFLGTHDDDFF